MQTNSKLKQFVCKLPASSCWNTLQKAARKRYKLLQQFTGIAKKFFTVFFSIRVLSRTLTIYRTARVGRGPSFIPLYHFYQLTNIQTYICNFACEMRWLSRVCVCVCVCVYILPPRRLPPSAKCPRHTWGYGSTIMCCEY